MMRHRSATRRGLVLAELLIGVAITAVIGMAVATTLISVSQGLSHSREARSALQRAFAAHSRVRAYFDPGLCVLDAQDKVGFAFWLHDGRSNGICNLLELRIFWFDRDEGTITVEWVEFPEEWDDDTVTANDIPLDDGTDYFGEMIKMRELGRTSEARLVDGLRDVLLSYDTVSVKDAERLRLMIEVELNEEEAHEVLTSLALPNHRVPD